MTKDQAIKEIDNLRNDIGSAYDDADQSPMWYALGMAIKALKERKTGRWVLKGLRGEKCVCSLCGSDDKYNLLDYRYCPYCGAKMGVDE